MKRAHAALFVLTSLVGIALGLGAYTFAYAKGWSYLTNDPRACANCHVMNEQYDGWLKGSHRVGGGLQRLPRARTTSSASTAPRRSNGFWHSYYFTTGGFHEPIQITAASRDDRGGACRHCHEAVVQAMGTPAHAGSREISCIRCHGSVGHLELSATNVRRRGEPWLSRAVPRAADLDARRGADRGRAGGAWRRPALTALLVNIMERKQEAKNPFFRVVELTDETEDPAVWGKNFPLQYDALPAHRGPAAHDATAAARRCRTRRPRPTRARSWPSRASRRTRG